MEDQLLTQEPIKVYENTYIMKPTENQRCVQHSPSEESMVFPVKLAASPQFQAQRG